MRDIQLLLKDGQKIVSECIGTDKMYEIVNLKINTRARSRWGQCKTISKGKCEIEISSKILDDNVPYNAVLSTMVHELLHACKGGHGHRGKWKEYANKVNSSHPELSITRCTSASFFGLKNEPRQLPKQIYVIKCTSCGNRFTRQKMSKAIKNIDRYRCGKCHGKLIVI